MVFAGAHLVLIPSQPGGHWTEGFHVSLGLRAGFGVPQGAGSPCPHREGGYPRAGTHLGSSSTAEGRTGCRTGGPCPKGGQPGVCPTPSMAMDGAGCSEVQLPGLRSVFILQAERELVIPKPSVFSQTSHSLAEETRVSRSPLSPLSYCFESERIGCRFQGMFRQRLFEQHLCK